MSRYDPGDITTPITDRKGARAKISDLLAHPAANVRLEYRRTKPVEEAQGEKRYTVGLFLTGWGYNNFLLGESWNKKEKQAGQWAAKKAIDRWERFPQLREANRRKRALLAEEALRAEAREAIDEVCETLQRLRETGQGVPDPSMRLVYQREFTEDEMEELNDRLEAEGKWAWVSYTTERLPLTGGYKVNFRVKTMRTEELARKELEKTSKKRKRGE